MAESIAEGNKQSRFCFLGGWGGRGCNLASSPVTQQKERKFVRGAILVDPERCINVEANVRKGGAKANQVNLHLGLPHLQTRVEDQLRLANVRACQ